jgi:hypothetical protein
VMRSLGQAVSDKEIAQMIAEVDEDGGGTIDFEEFVNLVHTQEEEEREAKEGARKTSNFVLAVRGVQRELDLLPSHGAGVEGRVEMLKQRWERQRMATAMWSAAFADDDAPKKEAADDEEPDDNKATHRCVA